MARSRRRGWSAVRRRSSCSATTTSSTISTWCLTLPAPESSPSPTTSSTSSLSTRRCSAASTASAHAASLSPALAPSAACPPELAMHSLDGNCDPELQHASEAYNPQMEAMLNQLNAEVGGGSPVFVAVNTRRMHADFIDDPKAYGFVTATEACCGQGRFNGIGICTMVSSLCANRDEYVFWDAFHPTERANRLIAQNYLTGSTDYISPMNLSTILHLDRHLHD